MACSLPISFTNSGQVAGEQPPCLVAHTSRGTLCGRPNVCPLSCTAKAYVPKPQRRDGCLTCAPRSAAREDAAGVPPATLGSNEALQRRPEAGPCQLLRVVRRRLAQNTRPNDVNPFPGLPRRWRDRVRTERYALPTSPPRIFARLQLPERASADHPL